MTEQQARSLREAISYSAPEDLEWKIGMLIDDAVAAEREACAKIADGELMEVFEAGEERIVKSIAEQIRARGASEI